MPSSFEALLGELLDKAKKAGATAADALVVATEDVSVSQRMGKQEGLERAESKGVGLRVFVGQKQASVSSKDFLPATLNEMVERAVAMAKVSPEDAYVELAPEALLARAFPDLDMYDANAPSEQTLAAWAAEAEEAALGVKGIANSQGAGAGFASKEVCIAATNGFSGFYRSTDVGISVTVLAGGEGEMERDHDHTSAHFVSDLRPAKDVGLKAAERTLKRVGARKVSSCKCPVVFEPRVGKELLGAFSAAINGSAIARGTSFLKNRMGEAVFAKNIRITDDPHRKRGPGSRPFDGEGVANPRLAVVEDGILRAWFLDIRTAKQLKLSTNGRAARSLAGPPSPSPTNLYIENGAETPEELIAGIKSGFYVTDTFGMGINTVTGDYSQGAAGFWIENGKISYPVHEITIAGHMGEMFRTLTPANDLEFIYRLNTPTLRVEGMTVAGA